MFSNPNRLTVDSLGNVYVADRDNSVIRKMTPSRDVTTFAGTQRGFREGDKNILARFNLPEDVTHDGYGNFYVVDHFNQLIRKISANGVVKTIAGKLRVKGEDNGEGLSATFNFPVAIVLDNNGNLFILDSNNFKVRKIGLNTPGGANNLALWLRADKGIIEVSTPATIAEWQDFSGNFRNAVKDNGFPKTSTSFTNYNPNVSFSGVDNFRLRSSTFATGYNQAEVFSVVKVTDEAYNGTNGHPFFFGDSGGQQSYFNDNNQNIFTDFFTTDQVGFNPETNTIAAGGAKTGVNTINGNAVDIRKWNIYGLHSETNNWGIHFNGFNKVKTTTNTFSASIATFPEMIGADGGNNILQYFKGNISEIILFDRVLTDAERTKINSYLAVKYGITLNNEAGGTAGDYIATDNQVIWDATAATGTYHNNVIGIGRDDSQDLYQKQSHTDNDTTVLYIGTHALNNNANIGLFNSDLQYVVMGDNGGKLCGTDSSNAEKPSGVESRLEREWRVTNANFSNTGLNIKIKLNDCAATDKITDAHLRMLVDDDGDFSNASVFQTSGNLSINYVNDYIVIRGFENIHIPANSTRYITIASSNISTPLPIDLQYFDAVETDDKVTLEWETATETNSDYFMIHKSKDTKEWEEIAKLDAAGNSKSKIKYTHTDHNPYIGTSYYRLSQVDIDGTTNSFPLEAVHIESSMSIPVSLYPNTVNNQLIITGNADELSNWRVVNLLGESVNSLVNVKHQDDSKIVLDL